MKFNVEEFIGECLRDAQCEEIVERMENNEHISMDDEERYLWGQKFINGYLDVYVKYSDSEELFRQKFLYCLFNAEHGLIVDTLYYAFCEEND